MIEKGRCVFDNGFTLDQGDARSFLLTWRKYGLDGPISKPQAKRYLRPHLDQNIHHRQPQSQGGVFTLRTASLLQIESEHNVWHGIYGSRCAAYTASVEHNIHQQLGTGEIIGLTWVCGGPHLWYPTLEVNVSSRMIDYYLAFRAGRSQIDYYRYINSKFNDPFFPWTPAQVTPTSIARAA